MTNDECRMTIADGKNDRSLVLMLVLVIEFPSVDHEQEHDYETRAYADESR